MTTRTINTASVEDTLELGARIGAHLPEGALVTLDGDLGTGKTHFVKGLARGLGVPDDEPVVSPTFVLVREYAGRQRLIHIDAYRLTGIDELYDLGFDEYSKDPTTVIAIEWAERVIELMPTATLAVSIAHQDAQVRRLILRTADTTLARRLVEIAPDGSDPSDA